jgi:hypothetical protein
VSPSCLQRSGHSWSFVRSRAYAIKAEIVDPRARTFTFTVYKTMYGGELIAEGDTTTG